MPKDAKEKNTSDKPSAAAGPAAQEESSDVKAEGSRGGVSWGSLLIQQGKVTFETLEKVLRYEFHSRSSHSTHESLGDMLVKNGAIAAEKLKEALREQKKNGRLLGSILLETGTVTRLDIGRALAMQLGMEFADFDTTPSDAEALEAVPESMALRNTMLPISIEGDRLSVLVTGPQGRERAKSAGLILGKRIDAMLTACDDLEDEIRGRYRELAEYEIPEENIPAPSPFTAKREEEKKSMGTEDNRFTEVAKQAAGASIVNMVSVIIDGAVNAGATDVHLDPQDPETRVRYRIDGVLHDVMSIPRKLHAAAVSRIKILADMDITESRHPQDGHFQLSSKGHDVDVRVATLPTFLGERAVLRLLDQSAVLSGIKDLGLEKEDEGRLLRLVEEPYGMILVTGPTGSGKTTTLYAALNQKNVMTESIVTLEDPVEYQLSGINQVQMDTDIGLTFGSTLRAALRQDIDVLLVGEIRDQETAHIAIRAAMTGHLVFSTLHTNDAVETIVTLRNMGIQPFLIASAVSAVIGQRLVRKICAKCKSPFTPTDELLKAVGMPTGTKRLYRGSGCSECHLTGNSGRTGIFELLEVNQPIRSLIISEATSDEIAAAAKLKTMADRCRDKIKAGIVSPEEYLKTIRI